MTKDQFLSYTDKTGEIADKSDIISPTNGCIEARPSAFSPLLSYCENQALLLWWWASLLQRSVVDKKQCNFQSLFFNRHFQGKSGLHKRQEGDIEQLT